MDCLIINIRRHGLNGIAFGVSRRVAIDFLFIGDVVLHLISPDNTRREEMRHTLKDVATFWD